MYSCGISLSRCQHDLHVSTPPGKPDNGGYDSHDTILLPLPSFPPPLDFDPFQFSLPPAYDEVVDIEKVYHSVKSKCIYLDDVPLPYGVSTCAEHFQSKTGTTQSSSQPRIQRHIRIIRHIRYTIFAVYQRLFTGVLVLNVISIIILCHQHTSQPFDTQTTCETLATLASSNLLVAVLMRQDCLINAMFRTAWLVSWSLPLWSRRIVARVYCYGGVHSGAAIAGTVWWAAFTIYMSWMFLEEANTSTVVFTWTLLALLTLIVLLAYPIIRTRYHNTFEVTHRLLGWTSIILFWVQLLLFTQNISNHSTPHRTLSTLLLHNPTFWNILIITTILLYPWLRLRRWTFTAHVLSPHAIRLSFPHPVHKFSCLSISSSPLLEWHPFATFPSIDPAHPGASMIVSNAGDWTHSIIQRAHAQSTIQQRTTTQMRFWIKSHPKAGVLSLSVLFSRVVILTTGSGIGPALSSLLDRPVRQHVRLIWSTRSPLGTYGADVLALVHRADPDAVILDTDAMGRPDLLELVWAMYKQEEMEAVFVLSNKKVVKRVVGGMEKRGVPAFGPIWDS